MWKSRDDKPAAPAPLPTNPAPNVAKEVRPMDVPKPVDALRSEVAHIGSSVLIKGELSGSEDLYLDGEVEGNIELRDHSLTVGPHGRVRAHINAREIIVHGKVEGNVRGSDRVELKRSAVLVGDIATHRIVIEDGAFFKGSIDIKKEGKSESKSETAMSASASYGSSSSSSSYSASSSSSGSQSTLLDDKKV